MSRDISVECIDDRCIGGASAADISCTSRLLRWASPGGWAMTTLPGCIRADGAVLISRYVAGNYLNHEINIYRVTNLVANLG